MLSTHDIANARGAVRTERQGAIEAAKAVALLECCVAPRDSAAVDPIETAAGIGDADGELIGLRRDALRR